METLTHRHRFPLPSFPYNSNRRLYLPSPSFLPPPPPVPWRLHRLGSRLVEYILISFEVWERRYGGTKRIIPTVPFGLTCEKKASLLPAKARRCNIMRLILLVARLMITETLLSFLSTGGLHTVRNESIKSRTSLAFIAELFDYTQHRRCFAVF